MGDNTSLLLRQKLLDAISAPLPDLTRRDTWIPRLPGKTLAVIGMRRSGKTSLLWQELADRHRGGLDRTALPLVSFEDERLVGDGVELLDDLLEQYFLLQPQWRQPKEAQGRACLFLDEIQLIPRWDSFIRRVMDTEALDLVLSGSSALMLSAEIASGLRGRALEAVVWPFSFREALRHAKAEPSKPPSHWSSTERSWLGHQLAAYLRNGGFPEAQGVDERTRRLLLTSYVDSTVLRDVIERHDVRQPLALQWLVRQLLGNAGGFFSVNRLHGALRSQGIAIGREQLGELVEHLQGAFLIQCLGVAGGSLRRQQSLPRKVVPIDPGLIPLYECSGRTNLGHALETVVIMELLRRGAQLSYVRSANRYEVDVLAEHPNGKRELVQICADLDSPATRARELRALTECLAEPLGQGAEAVVISLDQRQPGSDWPQGVSWRSAEEWLLESHPDPN